MPPRAAPKSKAKPKKPPAPRPAKEARGRGRPTLYDPAFCDVVVERMRQGASISEVAAAIGVCRQTVATWRETHEAFSAAMDLGETLAQAWWEREARECLALPGFNTGLFVVMARNRFGYRDKAEVELTHRGGISVDYADKVRDVNRRRAELLGQVQATMGDRTVEDG